GDDGALVADDGIVDTRLFDVRKHGPEHAAGDDDHAGAGSADARDRLARARSQHCILRDECAVEIDRERSDVFRECGRKLEQRGYGGVPPVALTTNAATSAICWSVSWPLNDGITPLPLVTRAVASR